MSRYELTISPSYVSTWGLKEGIREFVQNAIDQETMSGGVNKFTWRYSAENNRLEISNMDSVLEPKSLLLGATTKAGDKDTIGQFGEGYKLGALACIRAGYPVVFLNHGANENWTPHFIKSRRFGSTILVFDVEHYNLIKRSGTPNLTIQISGISMSDWSNLVDNVLQFQGEYEQITTKKGSILLDERHRGKVFVNGLFICELPKLYYGYNIPARYIALNRDRNMVGEFDTKWATSEIWKLTKDTRVLELIGSTDWEDAAYMTQLGLYSIDDTVKDAAHEKFTAQYGTDTVPVASQAEFERTIDAGHKAAFVTESYRDVVKASNNYSEPAPTEPIKASPLAQLREWFDNECKQCFSMADMDTENVISDFEAIYTQLEEG
jgi:hypothetical protein